MRRGQSAGPLDARRQSAVGNGQSEGADAGRLEIYVNISGEIHVVKAGESPAPGFVPLTRDFLFEIECHRCRRRRRQDLTIALVLASVLLAAIAYVLISGGPS